MRGWGIVAVVAGFALTPGCACSSAPAAEDAGADSAVPMGEIGVASDGSLDEGPDASDTPDGAIEEGSDAGDFDALVPFDGDVDAGMCVTGCSSTNPCMPSACNPNTGMCEPSTLADGTLCGEDETDTFVCVAAECVMRGCGDGLREPGSELWPREGCDDGNQADGDTCSMDCTPTEFVAQADPGTEQFDVTFAPHGQMLVFDGLGNGLLVWVAQYGGAESGQQLQASRIDASGNFLDVADPLVLDTTTALAFDMTPSAVGLTTGGFVVAWTARRNVQGLPRFVLLMRRIAADGTVGAEQAVHPPMSGDQRWPRLAALRSSFVVVWEGALTDVWGRRFHDTGAPMTTVMAIPSSTTGREQRPSVAAQGDAWMVTFVSEPMGSSAVRLRGRRFMGSGPQGNEFAILADHVVTHELAALGDDYLLAYTTVEFDFRSDLYAMTLPRASGALGAPLPLDATPGEGAANPHVAPYGPREQGGYLVVYDDGEVGVNPRFVTVNITPPSEVDTLQLLTRGEDWPAVAAAPYGRTGGSVWMAYTAQITGTRLGAVVFQLPPP